MAEVSLENIVKRFGNVKAVNSVSIDIPDGAFVILVGPSGCGKTTLLRLLAGLETATEGRITIGGRDVTNVHPRERDIAMVFQSYALYPHMSVRRNMAFALELKKVSPDEIGRRVSMASELLGISSLLDRRPKELSGGQRQRVALGRAIVREPAVFLFDEPLSNLDAKLRTAMRSELIKLHNRLGTTIVYVTHDQVEAMTMGQLVVVMKDGVVQQAGSPLEIYHNPQNAFVAEFIGSPAMNFLTGRVVKERKEISVGEGVFSIPLPDGAFADLARIDGSEIVVGVRPEHLNIGGRPVEGLGPVVMSKGAIEVVEPLGAETITEVKCQGLSLIVRLSGERLLKIGEPVTLTAGINRFFFFDRITGKRLQV